MTIIPDTIYSRNILYFKENIGNEFQLPNHWKSSIALLIKIVLPYLNYGVISCELQNVDSNQLKMFYIDLWNCGIDKDLWLDFYDKHLQISNPTAVISHIDIPEIPLNVIPSWRIDLNSIENIKHFNINIWHEIIDRQLIYPLHVHLKSQFINPIDFKKKNLSYILVESGLIEKMFKSDSKLLIKYLIDLELVDKIIVFNNSLKYGYPMDTIKSYFDIELDDSSSDLNIIDAYICALKGGNKDNIVMIYNKMNSEQQMEASYSNIHLAESNHSLKTLEAIIEIQGEISEWSENSYKLLLFESIKMNKALVIQKLLPPNNSNSNSNSNWNSYLLELASDEPNYDLWQSLVTNNNLISIRLLLDWLQINASHRNCEMIFQKLFQGSIFNNSYNCFRYIMERAKQQDITLNIEPVFFEHLILNNEAKDLRILDKLLINDEYLEVFKTINTKFLLNKLVKNKKRIQYFENNNYIQHIFDIFQSGDSSGMDLDLLKKILNCIQFESTVEYLYYSNHKLFMRLNAVDVPNVKDILVKNFDFYDLSI